MPTVLITGGSRGIGAATARLFAERGFDLCFSYVSDEASAGRVVAQCEALGRRALALKADVADPGQIRALFEACRETFGGLDVLVNNAGIVGARGRFEDLNGDDIRRTFDVNVYGLIAACQAAIPLMSTRQGGQGGAIVNLSSIAATLGSPGEYVHYAASKAAVDAITIGLGKELGPEGIRVNAVQAGTTDTDIHERAGNPERPAMVAATSPVGRCAEAGEIAEAIYWLASDQASYVTASVMRVGGGL
ncbi:MAG: SDR family oxidoreductase [Magnetovibrionaceae bacterium]